MHRRDEKIVAVDIDTTKHLARAKNSCSRQEVQNSAEQSWVGCHVRGYMLAAAIILNPAITALALASTASCEWITIAQTEDSQSSNASGMLSRSSEQGQSSLRVEMRVTVR
jgi:hypothetical protein